MLCLNNLIIAYGAKDLIQILQKNIRKYVLEVVSKHSSYISS